MTRDKIVAMFRDKVWLNFALTVRTVIWSSAVEQITRLLSGRQPLSAVTFVEAGNLVVMHRRRLARCHDVVEQTAASGSFELALQGCDN
jgi:hypothetical protein